MKLDWLGALLFTDVKNIEDERNRTDIPSIDTSDLYNCSAFSRFHPISKSSTFIATDFTSALVSTDLGESWQILYEVEQRDNRLQFGVRYEADMLSVYYNSTAFISYDYGYSWKKTDLGAKIYDIIVDPMNSSVVLAAVVGEASLVKQRYISYDKGFTFQKLEYGHNIDFDLFCSFMPFPYFNSTESYLKCFSTDFDAMYSLFSTDQGRSFSVTKFQDFLSSHKFVDVESSPYFFGVEPNGADDLDITHNNTWYSQKYNETLEPIYFGSSFNITGWFEPLTLLGDRYIFAREDNQIQKEGTDISAGSNTNGEAGEKSEKALKAYDSLFYISDSKGTKLSRVDNPLTSSAKSFVAKAADLPGTVFLSTFVGLSAFTNISTDNGITWTNPRINDTINPANYTCNINATDCTFVLTGLRKGYKSGVIFATGHESYIDTNIVDIDKLITDANSDHHMPPFHKLSSEAQISEYEKVVSDFIAISDDGGYTWRKLFQDPETHYLTGNFGNIIVRTVHHIDGVYTGFSVSLDQGVTWNTTKFSAPLKVLFLLDFDQYSNIISFSGHEKEKSFQQFLFVHNITEAYNMSVCEPEDLVKFSLNRGSCVNGARYTSYNSKPGSGCVLDPSIMDWSVTACERCSINDYICDPESTKDSEGKCVPDNAYLSAKGISYSGKDADIPNRVLIKDNMCKTKIM